MLRRLPLIVVSVISLGVAAWAVKETTWVSGDESLAGKVERIMQEEAAKTRFTGGLGNFLVVARSERLREETRIFDCPHGSDWALMNRADVSLRRSELCSTAFDVEEGMGLNCPGLGVVLVSNQGLQGATTDGEDVARIRGYIWKLPVALLRDAPRDRLQLIEVNGRPGLLEQPIEGYPYATSSLAVIERYPEGERPGILILVEWAPSAERAIAIAEEIMR